MKKIASARLFGFEFIYYELENSFMRAIVGREEKVLLNDKNALFKEWDETEELNIINKDYIKKYLESESG